MKKLLLFLALFSMLLSFSANADGIIDETELSDAAPKGVSEAIGGIDGAADTESALSKLWDELVQTVSDSLSSVLCRALSVIAVAVICGILTVFREGERVPDWIELSGCAAISVICLADLGSYISMCRDALNDISVFSQSLLPALCTLSAASGALTSAGVKYAASALFMDMFITAATELILPVILAFTALSAAAAAFDGSSLAKLCKVMKKLCVIMMTLLATGFTAYLGISGTISGTADAMTVKAAKTAISTALPVVGSVVSDAASSVLGGIELLKSTVGVFGMLVVAFVCIVPFAVLGINYLVFKLAAACVSMLSGERLSRLTNAVSDSFGMLLGLLGCAGLMMFVSIISTIKAVVA